MLHAFAHKKSTAFRNYLGARNPGEPRVSAEDEITSLIFGPLDFLSPGAVWTLWRSVLHNLGSILLSGPLPADFFGGGFYPTSCTQRFWARQHQIEPDLLIEFRDDAGTTRSILLEVKWGAGLSGADQLDKQWLHYHGDAHASSLHVFLAKHMGELPADRRHWACLDTDGSESSRLRALRWHEFEHEIIRLAKSPATPAPLKRWCELAAGFLMQVGIRPFAGFGRIAALAREIGAPDAGASQFWNRK